MVLWEQWLTKQPNIHKHEDILNKHMGYTLIKINNAKLKYTHVQQNLSIEKKKLIVKHPQWTMGHKCIQTAYTISFDSIFNVNKTG